MKPREIVPNVHLIGAVDWDRRLFDALIPLPHGTSYNAYFVQGSEKNALIDTVDPVHWQTLSRQLDELPAPDYLVVHHVEQDHSGSTPMLLERYPELTIVCNEKAKGMLIDHLHVDDARFQVVNQHPLRFLVADDREFGVPLEKHRRRAGVVLLHVMNHEVVRRGELVQLCLLYTSPSPRDRQ